MQAGSAGTGGMANASLYAYLVLVIHHLLDIGGAIGSGSF